jgi:hypothetical protein
MYVSSSRILAVTLIGLLLAAPMARPASAQERPSPAADFAAGALVFPDNQSVSEGFVGGALRYYVLPRVSVGPEVAYVRGDRHSHLMLTGNVNVDLLGAVNGRPRPVTPFAVVGGGLFRTREQFSSGTFTSSEGAFTAGAGVRALVGDRVTIGAEARVGWELHLRVNGIVGIRLGR